MAVTTAVAAVTACGREADPGLRLAAGSAGLPVHCGWSQVQVHVSDWTVRVFGSCSSPHDAEEVDVPARAVQSKDGRSAVSASVVTCYVGLAGESPAHAGMSPSTALAARQPRYYLSNPLEDNPLETLAYAGGSRWGIETEFETEKSDVGLDEYDTRTWEAGVLT